MKKAFLQILSLILTLSFVTSCSQLSNEDYDDNDITTSPVMTSDDPIHDETVFPDDTGTETDTDISDETRIPDETTGNIGPYDPDDYDILIENTLKNMTLKQKISQMIMVQFRSWKLSDKDSLKPVTEMNDQIAKILRDFDFGGVIVFSENLPGTASSVKLIFDMQSAAASSDMGIPLLIAADQEGGYVRRLTTGTTLCGNMALGAAGDPEITKAAASIIASELSALGINTDFAPDVDINNNPANPVIGVRSFSDDPQIVSEMGIAFSEGLHEYNVVSTLKHFPGHGDTSTDSHSGLPCITKTLDEIRGAELVPFSECIENGADMVMTAHIQYPEIEKETYTSISTGEKITLPATLSETFITDILRGELGFDGVVCTDAMQMDAIAKHFNIYDAAELAINAGVDMLLVPLNMSSEADAEAYGIYIDKLAEMAENGRISTENIDNSVRRILRLKAEKGIFVSIDNISGKTEQALSSVGSEHNHSEEWNITERTVTLVKNDGVLPVSISDDSSVAVFVTYSDEINSVSYAVDRMKDEGVIPKNARIDIFCYSGHSVAEFNSQISNADFVIASVETYRTANMNPSGSGGFQALFLDGLIEKVHSQNKKIAVISLQLPYDLARFQSADVLIAAYCAFAMSTIPVEFNGENTTYGPNLPVALSAVFGAFVPTGKLPVNIFKLDNNYNFTNEILYPRGYRAE